MLNKYISIFFLLLTVAACKEKDAVGTTDSGYQYFPLETVQNRVYEVTVRTINLVEDFQTTYILKEQIGEQYTEGEEKVFVLEKYCKTNETDTWKELPDTIETIRLFDGKLIQTENNTRYLKIVFPVSEGRQWNGNSYNTLEEDLYTIKSLDKLYDLNNQIFEKTMVIEQAADTSDLTKSDVRFEVYAYNTGLIYRKSNTLKLNFITGDTLEGTIFTQKLLYVEK